MHRKNAYLIGYFLLLIFPASISLSSTGNDGVFIYWEDLSEEQKNELLKSSENKAIINDLYYDQVEIGDNETTFKVLDLLSSFSEDNSLKALYFHLFNTICMKSDGALSEVMGKYCIRIIENAPDYVLNYLNRNPQIMNLYALFVSHEIGVKVKNGNELSIELEQLKTKLSEKASDDMKTKEGLNLLLDKISEHSSNY